VDCLYRSTTVQYLEKEIVHTLDLLGTLLQLSHLVIEVCGWRLGLKEPI
jgi:hypothetical protein